MLSFLYIIPRNELEFYSQINLCNAFLLFCIHTSTHILLSLSFIKKYFTPPLFLPPNKPSQKTIQNTKESQENYSWKNHRTFASCLAFSHSIHRLCIVFSVSVSVSSYIFFCFFFVFYKKMILVLINVYIYVQMWLYRKWKNWLEDEKNEEERMELYSWMVDHFSSAIFVGWICINKRVRILYLSFKFYYYYNNFTF